ncbi:MAG: 2-hydroxyacid dehydrogenase [Bacteroidota bacterium]
MSKPKVFVTRAIPDKGLDVIREFCEVDLWQEDLPPRHDELLKHVQGVDGLLCLLTDRVDRDVMDTAGEQLRVISNHAVGFDNIDVPAATTRKIPVGNTPDVLTDATADFAFALLMAVARRIPEAERFVQDGKWKTWGPRLLLGVDIKGATLGLIGFGRIGKAVAQRASGFDMQVIYYDAKEAESFPALRARRVDLETLLTESDFISIHTPLTSDTHHLIDAKALSKMKHTVVLINTARGPVVDPQALYEALKANRIFGAGLDVTEPEPIPLDSPLLKLDNVIVVPHIASASKSSRDQMSWMAAQNLIAGLNGERLPNCVNPQVYAQKG